VIYDFEEDVNLEPTIERRWWRGCVMGGFEGKQAELLQLHVIERGRQGAIWIKHVIEEFVAHAIRVAKIRKGHGVK